MKRSFLAASCLLLVILPGCAGIYHSIVGKEPSLEEQILAERPKELRKKRITGLTDIRFRTDESMIASSVLLASAEPYWRRFEELGWLDDVVAAVGGSRWRERITELGPAYAQYNIEALFFTSGFGVPLTESPHFDPSVNRRLLLRAGIEDYPIANTRPVYLEYVSGNPHYIQMPDFGDPLVERDMDAATLRWNPDWFDRTIEPATLGASLRAQVLWAQRLLSTETETGSDDFGAFGEVPDTDAADELEAATDGSDPDDDDFFDDEFDVRAEESAEDEFDRIFGATKELTPADRYLGLQLTEMAANKIIEIATRFPYSEFDERLAPLPEDYDPAGWDNAPYFYFPHKIVARSDYEPEDPENFDPDFLPQAPYVVQDTRSHLFDQAILLEGLLEFIAFAEPGRFQSSITLFPAIDPGPRGDSRPVFANTVPLMARRVATAIVRNILTMHWNQKARSLVTYAESRRQGTSIHAKDAGMALVALERFMNEPWIDAKLRENVKAVITAQGQFLMRWQYKDGAFADAIEVSTGDAAEPHGFQLVSQMYAIRGLLVAHRVTGEFRMRQAAWRTYLWADETLWAPAYDLYRVEDLVAGGQKHNRFTPLVVGATVSALRDLSLAMRDFTVVTRLMSFIDGMQTSSLLLSELQATGENFSSDEWDFDEDGILKPQYAGGEYGVAPVFASGVLIYIPSTGDVIPRGIQQP